ncbi:E3 ubiquitin-protein ligase KCMF1 isoform X2 [Drosophila virilis]|uniref:E3 ubiquitin-protein ligase KCMF1 isoform X2 n=1 Tax=Drosophila virilis TaxID=7244 RepID=UPI0038B261CB
MPCFICVYMKGCLPHDDHKMIVRMSLTFFWFFPHIRMNAQRAALPWRCHLTSLKTTGTGQKLFSAPQLTFQLCFSAIVARHLAFGMAMHWDVKCDGCDKTHLIHYRYKCLRCANYDLCAMCYENKVETGRHSSNHPFQCLLDRAARELFFAGEEIPDLCADSFTCPFCGKMGHAVKELVKHVQAKHRGDTTPVICPLCIAVPSADTVRMNNLVNHVSLMHGTGILRIGGGAGSTQVRTTGFDLPPIGLGQGQSQGQGQGLGQGQESENASHGLRSRSPPPDPARFGLATAQWPVSGHSLGSSASQEEDFYPDSWLPELSSLSGSMHTMRDTDLDLGGLVDHSQQLRRATPLSLLHQEHQSLSQRLNQSPSEPPHAIEEDFSDIEPDDIAGNEPTSSI